MKARGDTAGAQSSRSGGCQSGHSAIFDIFSAPAQVKPSRPTPMPGSGIALPLPNTKYRYVFGRIDDERAERARWWGIRRGRAAELRRQFCPPARIAAARQGAAPLFVRAGVLGPFWPRSARALSVSRDEARIAVRHGRAEPKCPAGVRKLAGAAHSTAPMLDHLAMPSPTSSVAAAPTVRKNHSLPAITPLTVEDIKNHSGQI